MTDQEFTRHALGVLMRELGPDGLARFLRRHRLEPAITLGIASSGKRA